MTKEFIKWVETVKTLIEKRTAKYCVQVQLIRTCKTLNEISITVEFLNGVVFWCSFHQEEFNKNNKNQLRTLAKVRRQNMAWQIEEFYKDMVQVVKRLN